MADKKAFAVVAIAIFLASLCAGIDFNEAKAHTEVTRTISSQAQIPDEAEDFLMESFVSATGMRAESAYVELSGEKIPGVLLYDGSSILRTSDGDLVLGSSFITYDSGIPSESLLDKEIVPYTEVDGIRHVYTSVFDGSLQCIMGNSFYCFGAEDGSWFVREVSLEDCREEIIESLCDRDKDLYDYDNGQYLNRVSSGVKIDPVGFQRTDWRALADTVEKTIEAQDSRSVREYLETNVYYALDALDAVLRAMNMRETFMGFACEDIVKARASVDDSKYVWITSEGLQVLDVPQTPSALARILTAVASVVAVGISVALTVVCPAFLPAAGALIGVALECMVTMSIQGEFIDPLDLVIGAISGCAGALLGVWSSALLDGCLSGVKALILGASLGEIAMNVGLGAATGLAIGAIAEPLGKVAKKILPEKKSPATKMVSEGGKVEHLTPVDDAISGPKVLLEKNQAHEIVKTVFDRNHPKELDRFYEEGMKAVGFKEYGKNSPNFVLERTAPAPKGQDYTDHVTYYQTTGDYHVHVRNSDFENGAVDSYDIIYRKNGEISRMDNFGEVGTYLPEGRETPLKVYRREPTVDGVPTNESVKTPYYYWTTVIEDGEAHSFWKPIAKSKHHLIVGLAKDKGTPGGTPA